MSDQAELEIPILHSQVAYRAADGFVCKNCLRSLRYGTAVYKVATRNYVCERCRNLLQQLLRHSDKVYI